MNVRVGEPGRNGSDGITCVFVTKVVDLAFEKNLMRANAVDFKKCIVGVVNLRRRVVQDQSAGRPAGLGARTLPKEAPEAAWVSSSSLNPPDGII